MVLATGALPLLAVIGAATALIGTAVLATQSSVKVSLAWSTVAQMGYMLLQCGLGAFALALLHIVAHSLYKAHAFLSSGSAVDLARSLGREQPQPRLPAAVLVPSLLGGLGVVYGIAAASGLTASVPAAQLALAAILVMALVAFLVRPGASPAAAAVFGWMVVLSLIHI